MAVSFFPDRRQLAAIARQVHGSRKAYPLLEIASLLLSKPEFYSVKIESDKQSGGPDLYQCKTCRTVLLDPSAMAAHVLDDHCDAYFNVEETEGEEPAGEFSFVARCGLSGAILPPPNHHSYAEKVQEIHQSRFSDMPIDAYRERIETVRDPELVEKWKQESRKRTIYRPKRKQAGDEGLTWIQAQSYFQRELARSAILEGNRAVMPAGTAREVSDQRLLSTIRSAWQRENRFPRSLLFSLRAAFKHMHLHVFKAGGSMSFVTHTRPVPLDVDHVVDSIREVLLYLRENPGKTRGDLVHALRPGDEKTKERVDEILQPLSWLIEKGHIIEFFNGTLSVPLASKGR